MFFDSHAHYDDKQFDNDREQLLKSLPKHGIDYVVNVAADMEASKKCIKLAEQYDYIYASVGVHPDDVGELNEEDINLLYRLSEKDKVVAIGEIGLDYYYDNCPRDIQQDWFIEQIELAKEVELPIIVHSRDSAKDTFDIIKDYEAKTVGGIIHCFSGSVEMAEKYVADGFYIGVGGIVTFKNAKKLVEVVKNIPLKSIVLETDCPYLAPDPNRGQRNDSSNLIYTAKKIADIKGISIEEVAKQTLENAKLVYNID